MRAIGDLIRQGKVRYFGLSNFRGWRIAEVLRLADQLGIDRPAASEPLYNIVDRTAEVGQLPAAGPTQRHEQPGHRPVVIVSPDVFDQAAGLPVVLAITNGGDFARRLGFAVSLSGMKTTGILRATNRACWIGTHATVGVRILCRRKSWTRCWQKRPPFLSDRVF